MMMMKGMNCGDKKMMMNRHNGGAEDCSLFSRLLLRQRYCHLDWWWAVQQSLLPRVAEKNDLQWILDVCSCHAPVL